MKDLFSRAEKYLARARRRRLWLRLVSLLSCAVLLFTTYAQILPAITMEASEFEPDGHVHTDACYKTVVTEEKTELDCPLELHTHTAACYDAGGDQVCGYADFVVHTHDRYCYDEKGRLVCTLPEIEEHTHTAQCWLLAEDAASDVPAAAPHVHTEECYTVLAGELLCEQEETDGHVHDESCYTETEELVCGLEEDEGHTHTDLCMDTEGLPELCGQEEREGHAHDESCYETVEELTCGQEEAEPHRHTEECYAQEKELTCGLEEGTDTAAGPAAPADEDEEQQEPICGLEEVELHTHTAACLGADGVPTCGQPEVLAHQHTEECFRVVQEASEEKVLDCPYSASGEPEKDKDDTEKEPGGDDAGDTDEKPDEGDGDTAEDPAPGGETPEEPTPAERLLEAVQSHIGEGESKDDFEEDEAGETHGATVFGAYYGLPYDKWDAMFLAYCMEEAGIKELPSAEECMFDIDLWAAMLASEGIYRMAGSYTPAPGDILFLDMDGDATADAVAVAEKWTDGRLTVIAGDSNDRVRRVSYNLEDESIVGYGVLADEKTEDPMDGEQDSEEDLPEADPDDGLPEDDAEQDSEKAPSEGEDAGKDPNEEGADGALNETEPDTGDTPQKAADKLLAVARGQIGYTESAEDYIEEDGERRGSTLYGEYYDSPYSKWDAMFVAYCLEKAGIEELPGMEDCGFDLNLWITLLNEAECCAPAEGYSPMPGDLVLFDTDEDGAADHIAIVEKVTDGRLWVIAGDSSDCVRRMSYSTDDPQVLCYAVLPVETEPGDTDGDTEDGQQPEMTVQTVSANMLTVHAVYEKGVLPEGALLSVTAYDPESDEYDAIKQQMTESMADSGRILAGVYPMEIHFEDEYGSEIEPEGSVTVTVMFEEPIQESAAEWAVFHLTDGAVEELENAAVLRQEQVAAAYALAQEDALLAPAADEALPALAEEDGLPAAQDDEENEQAVQGIVFETDSFSNFVLAGLQEENLVVSFRLWFWLTSSTEKDNFTKGIQVGKYDGTGIQNEVLTTEENTYLIPVSYFQAAYGEYGYSFDAENTENCPFVYAPDAAVEDNGQIAASLAPASYVQVEEAWYVQVQDTGTYGAPPRSNVYYVPEDAVIKIDSFYLWIHEATRLTAWADSETITPNLIYSNPRWVVGSGFDGPGLEDALRCVENGQIYYLIPVGYFERELAGYGYVFDAAAENMVCPLRYAPNAGNTGVLEAASYKQLDGTWYVRVRDTTGEAIPRSNIYYYHYEIEQDTKDHPGTVINLFDYWVNEDETDAAGNVISGRYLPDTEEYNRYDTGINQGHELKFLLNASTWLGNNGFPQEKYNVWTGSKAVCQGIVNETLTGGYPTLAIGSEKESLAYLFDPYMQNDYKKSYTNVSGLMQVNSDGYYYYNSQKNYAEFDGQRNITLYTVPGVLPGGSSPKGQFFPFNPISQVGELKSTDEPLNHYFGMTLFTRFYQENGGTNSGKDMIFKFSGDDDVWIFIDGVLVADLGGNHDAASVEINFANGNVTINDNAPTTLYAAFEAARKTDSVQWNGATFKDDTAHTLSFFYLERGNTDSNLYLEYNLVNIPVTSIFKVNQYGEPVEGARFEVYQATEGWKTVFDSTSDGSTSDGSTLSVYSDVTDVEGQIIFKDDFGKPLTLPEIKERFGEYFVLRETDVPEGYRKVSDDIYLYIEDGILLCGNQYSSGAWATSTVQVSATPTLYKAEGDTITDYYDVQDGTLNGTLFAVVLKRIDDDLDDEKSWAPVYGNSVEGYTVCNVEGEFISAVIKAAKKAQDYGTVEFSIAPNSGALQVQLDNLPGDIQSYYYMLGDAEKEKTQYTIAYYYTTADSLGGANSSNTVRIDANPNEAKGYEGFTRIFGATVLVPNLSNRLMVQKLDENGNLTNGATFALYKVREKTEETKKKIYYIDKSGGLIYLFPDDDGDNKGTATIEGTEETYQYTINQTGVITITQTTGGGDGGEPIGKEITTITPTKYGTTKYDTDAKEDGTYTFKNLEDGYYYVREIDAPSGYRLNTTEVMVLVNDEAIYANAGTADDGVTVARGPGYLVKSLSQFASEGDIDNTLTWIYEMMRISEAGLSFADFETALGTQCDKWSYLKTNRTGETAETDDSALKVYLKYNPDEEGNALFNYEVNTDRYNRNDTTLPSRRLYTTVGWSYYEIYQDTEWGEQRPVDVAYTDLSGKEIANLFSRSTYIQVTDEPNYTYELPSTGGRGRLVYTVCGLALIAAPLMYQFLRRRKGGM